MNKKTALVMVTAILLAVAAGTVGATYSRYTSAATATPQAQVAKWKVSVGSVDISNGEPQTFTAQVNWDTNENILNNGSNLIAPGSSGKITFIIDATGSEVPVDYTIDINNEEIADHSQITIEKVGATPNAGQETFLAGDISSEYRGNITLTDISKPVTINVYVKWAAQGANDADDTKLGAEAPLLNLPITVTASQHIATE